MKKSTLIVPITSIVLVLMAMSPINAQFKTRIQTLNGHSIIGIHVLQINFITQGYSYQNSGSVTDMYFDYWAWFPNSVSNPITWKAHHPRGEYARGTVDLGVGINSPWGLVGLSTGRESFSILY